MNEVLVEYQRCENKQIFKAESVKNSELFEALDWQHQTEPLFKRPKLAKMPVYSFKQVRDKFNFESLLTRGEVIDAMGRVRRECNKVIDMQLFNTATSKALKLEEFEQSQLSAANTVELYLKEPWTNACKGGILAFPKDAIRSPMMWTCVRTPTSTELQIFEASMNAEILTMAWQVPCPCFVFQLYS